MFADHANVRRPVSRDVTGLSNQETSICERLNDDLWDFKILEIGIILVEIPKVKISDFFSDHLAVFFFVVGLGLSVPMYS